MTEGGEVGIIVTRRRAEHLAEEARERGIKEGKEEERHAVVRRLGPRKIQDLSRQVELLRELLSSNKISGLERELRDHQLAVAENRLIDLKRALFIKVGREGSNFGDAVSYDPEEHELLDDERPAKDVSVNVLFPGIYDNETEEIIIKPVVTLKAFRKEEIALHDYYVELAKKKGWI